MKVKIVVLRRLMERVVSSKYYSRSEARKIVEPLVFAVVAGKASQGVIKLFGPEPHQNFKPVKKIEVIRKTPVSLVVDGGFCAGPLAAQIACDNAIALALKKGIAVVGVRNTVSSIGALSFYARKIAQAGFVCIIAANSPKAVVHFPGVTPVYGTNPICFAFPTISNSIVFDMSSSIVPFHSIAIASELGQKIPEGVALDKTGLPTTDPAEAMKGALFSFDKSFKGSGIAMSVELLAGVLTNSSFVFDDGSWGSVFIVLSPDLLSSASEFKKNASELVRKVKESKTPDGLAVRIPGFDSEEEIRQVFDLGEVDVDSVLFEKLKELAKNA